MKKIVLIAIAVFFTSTFSYTQIGVDATKSHLISKKDNKPFFWLADTGWELFHRLNREEATHYLETRAKQKFNVVMAVALAELNGLEEPNAYGHLPFKDLETLEWAVTLGNDPNINGEYDYWDHMDFIIQEAARREIYIGLLPTWGDKVAYNWGEGPMIFNNNPGKAYEYTKKLTERYKDQWNIIWIVGGDRPVIYEREGKNHDDRPIWRAMAKAIEDTYGKNVFIAFHPETRQQTSVYLSDEEWLDMYTLQSGHSYRESTPWEKIINDMNKVPKRPVMDIEPCYEEHPVRIWDPVDKWTPEGQGYFDAYDVRVRIYRNVFAGAAGTAYGHHHVWQFVDTTKHTPINLGEKTMVGWQKAIASEGAGQMRHLKDLIYSRSFFNRVKDNSMIVSDQGSDYRDEILASRDKEGRHIMIHIPCNKPITIDFDQLKNGRKRVSWFNPATGKQKKVWKSFRNGTRTFTPPDTRQKDWVLIIDRK